MYIFLYVDVYQTRWGTWGAAQNRASSHTRQGHKISMAILDRGRSGAILFRAKFMIHFHVVLCLKMLYGWIVLPKGHTIHVPYLKLEETPHRVPECMLRVNSITQRSHHPCSISQAWRNSPQGARVHAQLGTLISQWNGSHFRKDFRVYISWPGGSLDENPRLNVT
jgi:hypothetical protein